MATQMKARISFLTLFFLASSLVFTSCDDDDDKEEPTPSTTTDTTPDGIPNIPGADGAIIAIETVTPTDTPLGPFEIVLGTGVAVFYDTNLVFQNAGNVSLNGNDLTRNSNNSYIYIPTATEIYGIEFNGTVDWAVEGSGDVPGFSGSPSFDFPSIGTLSGDNTVDRSQDYSYSVSGVSGADSIIYNINGLIKTQTGNETTVTFTADELSSLASGAGVIQATPYRMESQDFSGKTIYFVNEKVVTMSVTIQ